VNRLSEILRRLLMLVRRRQFDASRWCCSCAAAMGKRRFVAANWTQEIKPWS
jgi:hypothetical protein